MFNQTTMIAAAIAVTAAPAVFKFTLEYFADVAAILNSL
jgi:hypothetical protein